MKVGYKCWHEIDILDCWNMLLVWLGRNSMIVLWWCLIG